MRALAHPLSRIRSRKINKFLTFDTNSTSDESDVLKTSIPLPGPISVESMPNIDLV